MKVFFPKSSVHPATECGAGTESDTVLEQSTVVPIISELNYFERRLNTEGNLTTYGPLSDLNSFVIRKYQRNSEDPYGYNEPCKYEVYSPSGHLVYFIAEQTEYFVHGTTCLSKPETIEFNITSPGIETFGMKYFLEFGRSGYSTEIRGKVKDRLLGRVSRACRLLSPYNYSIRDSSDKAIMNIKPKESCRACRFNLFPSSSHQLPLNQFGIYSSSAGSRRRRNICKGKIQVERDAESEIESYSLSLFHGVDSLGKSLLISAVILIDLQMSPRSKPRLFNCHVLSCLPQFIASICFYIIFLVLITTFVMLIVVG